MSMCTFVCLNSLHHLLTHLLTHSLCYFLSNKAVVPFAPPVVKAPTPSSTAVKPPVVQEKRGSLLDSEKATSLLITAKIREEDNDVSDSDEDDEDWD